MRTDRRSKAKRAVRAQRKRVLIYCAALSTEPDYFTGLRREFPSLMIEVRGKGRSPREVVEEAADYVKRGVKDYEAVWCVCDVDDYVIARVLGPAKKLGIELAVSKPCFEVWLLLHFCMRVTALQDQSEAENALKKFLKEYDKTSLRFTDYAGRIEHATDRALKLDQEITVADPFPNPSTGVGRLLVALRELALSG